MNLMASVRHQPSSKESIKLHSRGAHGGKIEQQTHASLAPNVILGCPHPE